MSGFVVEVVPVGNGIAVKGKGALTMPQMLALVQAVATMIVNGDQHLPDRKNEPFVVAAEDIIALIASVMSSTTIVESAQVSRG
ncbi:MAG: hypothetical protein KGL46_14390 [Hyphomicrobiales bacterium]|nr:hypothetical protein [Hyphomicrobiales bacterium]